MSIQQPVDPDAVEQARQQLRGVVAQLTEVARSNIEPDRFYDLFIAQVVTALAARGGAMWIVDPDGKTLRLQSPSRLPPDAIAQDARAREWHLRKISQVFASGEPALLPPGDAASAEEESSNLTPYLLVLAPLRTKRQPYGVVEVFQRADAAPATQRGYLRFLLQLCELAAEYLTARELQGLFEREALWARVEQFVQSVHESLDLPATAYTLANEACRLVECDRVSVVVCRRGRTRVEAVSGQDTVEHRSNAVKLLNALAQRVVATGDPLWYSGDTADMPPQVEEALHAYVDETHTRTLGIVPLTRQQPEQEHADADRPQKPEVLGALVIERIDQAGLTEAIRQRTSLVCRHGTAALANALTHDRIFLMPVWRALSKLRWFVAAQRLPKTLVAGGVAVAAIVALCLIPANFRITAQGIVQPAGRSDIFVLEPGIVKKVLVKHGGLVAANAELVNLQSRDLEVAIEERQGRLDGSLEQMRAVQLALAAPRLSSDERSRLTGQYEQLLVATDSLQKELRLLKEKEKLLTLKSPIDGIAVTWDLENRLRNRPVEKGQLLMSVADPKSAWELELMVPEAHAGHVVRAWQKLPKLPQGKRSLPVNFILATNPATTHEGTVTEIQQMAEVRGEEGSTVLVRVAIDDRDKFDPSELRPGAAVTGRIYCGSRSIGYVWFHDVLAFIRGKILFRL